MDKNLKIEIRAIPGQNNIRGYSKNLEYFAQSKFIGPLVDTTTRTFMTGLSEKDIAYLKEKNCPYDVTDITYNPSVGGHEIWESTLLRTELKNTPTFLYPGKSFVDFIKYKYLLVHPHIYSSLTDLDKGHKPNATHYIHNEHKSKEMEANDIVTRNKLISKVSKLSLDRKRQLVTIILNEITDNLNESDIIIKLDNVISNDKHRVVLEDILNYTDDRIETTSLVKKALQKQVLRRTKQGIFYFDSNLGFDESKVIEFLEEVENQEVLIAIKEKL